MSLAESIARLDTLLRTGTAPARSKRGDTPEPAGGDRGNVLAGTARGGNGRVRRRNTNANRRNGGGSVYYRPDAAYFAGNPIPATARVSAPHITPVAGIKVAVDPSAPGYRAGDARAIGTDNGYRAWVSARGNLTRDAGDIPGGGESYPSGISKRGNLAPTARY
ncbi:MAG TPA: hypothetical protein VGG75_38620 [Trebonia sp.]